MTTGEPTTSDIRAFIDKLRNKASFLEDPALIDAADFLQRIYDYRQMHETEARAAAAAAKAGAPSRVDAA